MMDRKKRTSLVRLSKEQAVQIGHFAALFGDGTVRPHDNPDVGWVWFQTKTYDWCIDDQGRVRGFNDV